MDNDDRKFGVIGVGSVGSSMIHALSRYFDYETYDICDDDPFEQILDSGAVFICVPTDMGADGRLDCSHVRECVSMLDEAGYGGVVVVKSTLRVGFCDILSTEFPRTRLVYMPEFLRERNCFSWCAKPDRIVLAGNDRDMDEVLEYFRWVDPDVKPQRMSYREAEFGKVVHNAFIALKVSFTNTVEMASDSGGLDPDNVMGVVWSDRRVVSREHLRPHMGGYSGKCIPKDTSEMGRFVADTGTDCSLIQAVMHVNSLVQPSEDQRLPEVYVILTTSQQDALYRRALDSISRQILKPKRVFVVYDASTGLSKGLKEGIDLFSDRLEIQLICNHRVQSLSGAVNSALSSVPADGRSFVAILDDDDYWDRRYLLNSTKFAEDVCCDMVVSGIVRHDAEHPDGFRQAIPDSISIHDFLAGNPGIQGSNMFVTAAALKSIGGFSEDLISTTDRDVCIRLLDSGIKYGTLYNHMVHHDCISRKGRLSDPGSVRKSAGLRSFYFKHMDRMTPDEREAFHRRSEQLFGIDTRDLDRGDRDGYDSGGQVW